MSVIKVEIAVRVLDEYLLTGEVPREDVLAVIDRLRSYYRERWSQSGKQRELPYGLGQELSKDEDEAFEALLHLRLSLVSIPPLNEPLLSKLRFVCKSYVVMREYVQGKLSKRVLENKLCEVRQQYDKQFKTDMDQDQFIAERSDETHIMLNHVRSCIAMVGDPTANVERIDVVDACIRAMRRLEIFWYNTLENRMLLLGA